MSIDKDRIEKFAQALLDEDLKNTEWKPDCQGKFDFDFDILQISTRFYSDNTVYSSLYLGTDFEVELARFEIEPGSQLGAPCAKRELEERLRTALKSFYVSLLGTGDPEVVEKAMTKAGF